MILVKTERGHQVMKDRSVPLTPRQRSAFILVDGRRSADDLLAATQGTTPQDIAQLLVLGLVHEVKPVVLTFTQTRPVDVRSSQERYCDAYPIATSLTAELGLRGFRLNLAIEAASSYEQLLELAPKIREAVGAKKFAPLREALGA